MFRGFGTFELRERAARESVGLNGERIKIPAYNQVHFVMGKALKRFVNGEADE